MDQYVEVLRQISQDQPDGNPKARASWETMDEQCALSANWIALEHKVFGSKDCGGLLQKR